MTSHTNLMEGPPAKSSSDTQPHVPQTSSGNVNQHMGTFSKCNHCKASDFICVTACFFLFLEDARVHYAPPLPPPNLPQPLLTVPSYIHMPYTTVPIAPAAMSPQQMHPMHASQKQTANSFISNDINGTTDNASTTAANGNHSNAADLLASDGQGSGAYHSQKRTFAQMQKSSSPEEVLRHDAKSLSKSWTCPGCERFFDKKTCTRYMIIFHRKGRKRYKNGKLWTVEEGCSQYKQWEVCFFHGNSICPSDICCYVKYLPDRLLMWSLGIGNQVSQA